METYYSLRQKYRSGAYEITSGIPFDIIDMFPFPKNMLKHLDEVFYIKKGKKAKDVITKYGAGYIYFYSTKLRNFLVDVLQMGDVMYPIKIDGIDEHYWFLYDLPELSCVNNDTKLYMTEPLFFYKQNNMPNFFSLQGTRLCLFSKKIKELIQKNFPKSNFYFLEDSFYGIDDISEYIQWKQENHDWKPECLR